MIRVLIIFAEEIYLLVAAHPEIAGGDIAHAAIADRREALPIQADLVSGASAAINAFCLTAFAPQAYVFAFTSHDSANLCGAGTFTTVNAFNSSTFTASTDILTKTGILPANLRRARTRTTVDSLECPAVLAKADILATSGIQPADLCCAHAGAAALAAYRVRAALAAGTVRDARSTGGVAAGIVADEAVVRAVAAVFPVQAAVVVDGAGQDESATATGGALDGTLVLTHHRATCLAFLHVAHFVVDRAVSAADPAQAALLAQGAGLDDRAGAACVAFPVARV